MGFSVRPPPAIWPTVARHELGTIFFDPDGSLMRVFPVSGLCEMTMPKSPEARARGSGPAGARGAPPAAAPRRERLIEEVGVLLSAAEAFDQSGAPNAAAKCGSRASALLGSLRASAM